MYKLFLYINNRNYLSSPPSLEKEDNFYFSLNYYSFFNILISFFLSLHLTPLIIDPFFNDAGSILNILVGIGWLILLFVLTAVFIFILWLINTRLLNIPYASCVPIENFTISGKTYIFRILYITISTLIFYEYFLGNYVFFEKLNELTDFIRNWEFDGLNKIYGFVWLFFIEILGYIFLSIIFLFWSISETLKRINAVFMNNKKSGELLFSFLFIIYSFIHMDGILYNSVNWFDFEKPQSIGWGGYLFLILLIIAPFELYLFFKNSPISDYKQHKG